MAAPMDEKFENDDLYANLGVSKEASDDQIRAAFRRLSRIYHPDKHTDEEKKESAVLLFNKIKYAYEILIDPHRRAVYDTLGLDAVETDGWAVVVRTKTPSEIREEYERLARENEERRLNQRTNPRGSINVGIDATDVFDRYEDLPEYGRTLPSVEISNMAISQSVEAPLTGRDTAVLHGNLSTQNGTGGGSVAACLRRTITDGWVEAQISAGNGPGASLKGFRNLTRRIYGTMAGSLQMTPRGDFRPSLATMLSCQLDKNLQGRLTWNAASSSSMITGLVWENPDHRCSTNIHLGLSGCHISATYSRKFIDKDLKVKGSIKFGTFGGIVEYGFDKKISQFSIFGASLVIGLPTGVLLKLKLNRGNQMYNFPVHLSETINYEAIFYGTVIPVATFYIVAKLLVDPFLKEEKKREKEKQKAAFAEQMKEKKEQAEAARELMKETVRRIREQEESKKGLIVLSAVYGKLASSESSEVDEHLCIDVTDPLQCLVKNSQLVLPKDQSKAGLPGFYDPCMHEEKVLYVRYKFRDNLHHVTIPDSEDVRCPLQRHIITTNNGDS